MISQDIKKAVIILSIFSGLNRKTLNKKRETYCEDAGTFIQVHFVRERDSERYAFNTLPLKSDPERDECMEWYRSHDNPDNFIDIVALYLEENKVKAAALCNEYGLESKVFSKTSGGGCSVEKWEAIAICFGLDLNLAQARALLKTVGYALTNSSKTDLIIRYCFENNIYKLSDINYILQKLCERDLSQIA